MLLACSLKIQQPKLIQIAPNAGNIYFLSECATGNTIDVDDAYGQNLEFMRKPETQLQ